MDVQSTSVPIVSPGAPAANAGGVPSSTAAAPAPAADSSSGSQSGSSALAPAIAKLFGTGTSPAPLNLNVSYKVVDGLDEVVTVFSDPHTGQEIAQFPSQILIGLAEFFDQERGATLDRSA